MAAVGAKPARASTRGTFPCATTDDTPLGMYGCRGCAATNVPSAGLDCAADRIMLDVTPIEVTSAARAVVGYGFEPWYA
jgi:hypothetical protein